MAKPTHCECFTCMLGRKFIWSLAILAWAMLAYAIWTAIFHA